MISFFSNICKVGIFVGVKMRCFFLSVVGREKNKISEAGSLFVLSSYMGKRKSYTWNNNLRIIINIK